MTGLSLILLLAVATMVPLASAQDQGGISNCCRKISQTNPRKEQLTEYYIQSPAACKLRVVVFITKKGKRICSDPDKQMTKTRMAYLDKRNWKRMDPLAAPGT
ncbi:C-C motif chemokine 5-like [Austrofundulus limnaeus]|uniref:C-C motif chemokine 5-like n=1 Tax=Austrofundulus limnaeus TaxID=52670 RepID=A0A2I4BTG2_AUSLI|nr:PREDICTED: C-C motif chemokine 5-like [Austrofundulus limnaeus]